MALRSDAAASAAAGECCCRLMSCAQTPGTRGVARTISCKPRAIGGFVSCARGGDYYTHEDGMSAVSYGSLGRESQWLSENYLNLRLRSSGLISSEAAEALKRHFVSRDLVSEEAGEKQLLPDNMLSESQPVSMLQSAFEDVSIADWELLLQNHLSRVSGPRCSFLDESWC